MAQQAPKYRTDRSADKAKSFTSVQVAAVTTLDNVAGKFPPFPPQVTKFHNSGAAGSVTVTLEDGTDFIIELAAGETTREEIPIKAFKSVTTATVTARCFWWFVPQHNEDKNSFVLS
jgi:hypothetical protein